MRKLVLNAAVSLDGKIEGPLGEYDWCFTDQDYGMDAFLKRTDEIIMGRKSFDMGGKDYLPERKHYVVTNRDLPEGAERIDGDIGKKISALKSRPGKDIFLFGGAELVIQCIELELLDEMSLAIHPLVLGPGKPLFSGINKRYRLRLENVQPFDTGLLIAVYTLVYSG